MTLHHLSRWGTLILVATIAVTLAGCGGAGRRPIEGAVTFDGEAIDEGSIAFIPENVEPVGDDQPIKVGGEIIDGRYQIPAEKGPLLGTYKVLVFWDKKTGKTYTDPDSEEVYHKREEAMPEMYRDQEQTPLKVEFVQGQEVYDITITSSE